MSTALSYRIFFYLLMAGLWYGGLWLLAVIATSWYLYRYTAYELIVLGWCLDVQFMTGIIPWYTVGAALAFVFIEGLKPRLLSFTA